MEKANQKQLDMFSKSVAKDDSDHWYHPRLVVIRPEHYRYASNQRLSRKPVHQLMGSMNQRHK